MHKIKGLLFLIALLIPPCLFAQGVYTLQQASRPARMGNKFVFLRDATHKMTLKEVLESNEFKPNTDEVPNFDVTTDAVWGKIKLTCQKSADWYLVFESCSLNKITFYQKCGNSDWHEVSYGNTVPETQNACQGRLLVKLDVQPGDTTTLLFSVHEYYPLQFDFKAGTLDSFIKPFHNTDMYNGICFGVMIMMLIYNLYLFLTQKQSVYIYYVLYVFFNGIFLAVFSGYFFYMPRFFRPIILFDPIIFPAGFGIFLILFTLKLFNNLIPKILKQVLYFFSVIVVVDALLGAFGMLYFAFDAIRIFGLLLGVLCITTGVVAQRKGSTSARFYILGFGAYLGGLAFLILSGHLIPANSVSLMAVITGSMVECIFLSFAQADKLKVFQLEKERAQAEALVQLQRNEKLIREQNVVLEQKVNERTAELAEKNKEILDSIHYAERIQSTLLAHEALLKQNIPEHFVLFKPKDIVSGDFYWATQKKDRFYLAACDSTGHGVPGAFMSLLNISLLNEAINEKDIIAPHEVFNYVRSHLINSISRDGGRDGMDGILVCLEKDKHTLKYVAANNEPLIVRNTELIELPADKMPVGQGERKDSFTLHEVTLQKGDMLYLYTDGYADQFGGPKGKKFKHRQVGEKLLELSQKTMKEQEAALEDIFNEWKGDLEQIDDVLVIGVRI